MSAAQVAPRRSAIRVRPIIGSLFAVAIAFVNQADAKPARSPNILFIYADDHSPKTVSCYEKLYSSKYFWVSNLCLNFSGASHVDVVIDLGNVYPIAQIFTHHGSNPSAGIAQPSRAECTTAALTTAILSKSGSLSTLLIPSP